MKQVLLSLSPKQAATVAFISTFVTVVGGAVLAYCFYRLNNRLPYSARRQTG